jgi:predicted RNA-binding Zn-ribbon protein involved in translation (DUF1610 family)
MSVLQTVKETIGLEESALEYECNACGAQFNSGTEPGSYWFECPECGEDDAAEL